MSDDADGEIGGDSGIGDSTGECGGVVKRDEAWEEAWEVKGDEGGSVSQGAGLDLWDLVRGASVGVCGFCNSEGKLNVAAVIV
jgi:hypothetical protein